MSKRIERLSLEKPVSSSIHRVALKRRQLVHRFVERHGKSTGGIVVAEQYIGDRRTSLFTWIPRLHYCTNVSICPVDCDRAARKQDQHNCLTRRGNSFKQLLL